LFNDVIKEKVNTGGLKKMFFYYFFNKTFFYSTLIDKNLKGFLPIFTKHSSGFKLLKDNNITIEESSMTHETNNNKNETSRLP